ncbi:PIN domain-containing protein [Candidatus Woesearchaeota archaeon]|nr:PIN domain-containing protein [Candidatus Woesearchaeota archaeon]
MYLDTDVLLALLKDRDWLKPHISQKLLHGASTSVLNILEAEIVMQREGERDTVLAVGPAVRRHHIAVLPVDDATMILSEELLAAHETLSLFDSVHAALCLRRKLTMYSTDHIYDALGVPRVDPRD